MSILIKGIDMPKDTHGETVLDDIRLIFSNANTRFSISLDKDDIIQIPTPHGRLIDAEELIEAHYNYCNKHHGEIDAFYVWSENLMDNAPTILEAEE